MNDQTTRIRPRATPLALALALALALPLGTSAQSASTASARVLSADFIVAVVNSEPVTNGEVLAMRARLTRDLARRDAALPAEAQLNQQALEMLISEKVQLQQAQEQGIKIDDEQVEQTIATLAASNQLPREVFLRRLAEEGVPTETFRTQLRDQLALQRLREREVDARVRVSESDIEQYLREQGQGAQLGPLELNLAMILVAVPESSSEAEIQALRAKADDIARRARAGEDFARLAQAHSQAQDKGANGGVMGLRPADRYPELFAQAVQGLKAQDIAGPVRSGAGFHVLKVIESRQSAAVMKVTQSHARHILLRPGPNLSPEQAVARLQEVRRQIQAGRANFARVAQEISQDGSAPQGGDLGWTSPGQFVPEFEQVMNRLQVGQISEPLVSRFGVHLLEVTERREVNVPEKEQRDMARAALREKRLDETYERWLEEVRGRAYVEMREALQLPPLATPAAATRR